MKDAFFYNNFHFNNVTFKKQKYTDARSGSPYHYLAYLIEGHSKIVSDNITIELWPGDLFYIPEGLPYRSYWDSNENIRFLSFGFHHFPEYNSKRFLLQIIDCNDDIKEMVKRIPIKATIDSSVIGDFYSTLAKVVNHLKYNPKNSLEGILKLATQYIYDNPDCCVLDVASHCLMSPSSLYHLFKRESNGTPNELIQTIRCQKAEVLLTTTDNSIQEISDILGFSSTSYFRKILKSYTGKTPKEIRNSAKII